MANIKYKISPKMIPVTTATAGRKPEAIDLATVAKTPGPGLAAKMNNAIDNPISEIIVF
ncbi:MAG: hypothetical protein MUP22_11670 [Desulfobacterales bacterium]|nr:hypothetical protein [Desulfobacterales bacterium]